MFENYIICTGPGGRVSFQNQYSRNQEPIKIKIKIKIKEIIIVSRTEEYGESGTFISNTINSYKKSIRDP